MVQHEARHGGYLVGWTAECAMSGAGGFAVPPQQTQGYSSGQIAPGSITYTTSTNPDGTVMYHPFKAVPASYQTAQGVVHGIQWVPAEATQILPQGAQPATAEFAASWNRGNLNKDEQRALEKWQRSEEKRRRKEEKHSMKRISQQFERDAAYGTPGTATYGTYTSEIDRRFGELEIERREPVHGTRSRKNSYSGANRNSIYGPPAPGAGVAQYTSATGYPTAAGGSPYNRATSPFRPAGNFSTPNGYPPGAPNRAASPFRPAGISNQPPSTYPPVGATSPYRPVGNFAPSPNTRPQDFSPSTYPGGPEPIARAASPYAPQGPSPYGARAPSPMPQPAPRAPSRAPSPYHGQQSTTPAYPPRAPSPFVPPPQIQTAVYPRGHILEGQPITAPRSRAPSPMPSAPAGPGYGRAPSPMPGGPGYGRAPSPMPGAPAGPGYGRAPSPMPTAPAGPGYGRAPSPMPGGQGYVRAPSPMRSVGFVSSPRMPSTAMGGEPLQLAAPEAFSRPPNAAQPYTPFNVMRIQDMDDFYDQIPRMPLVLDTHDVYHQDWIRFMNDLALAWAGKMPIPEFSRGEPPPKRSTLVADLINLWNDSFFRSRRVEVILYKGRERRSGPHAGSVDSHLPMPVFDSDSDLSDESSESSESDDGGYYGRGMDLTESKRMRREIKEEKKRRKKEKKLRKKIKEREKQYTLYLTYNPPREMPTPGGHNFYG